MTEEEKKPARELKRPALILLAVALLLFILVFSLPHLLGRNADLVERFGLTEDRGAARARLRPSGEGDYLTYDLVYESGGFLYLWVLEVEPGGNLAALEPPDPDDADAEVYGRRADPRGEIKGLVVPSDRPRNLIVYFSGVPRRLSFLQEAAMRSTDRSARSLARMLPPPSTSLTLVVPPRP